MRVFAFLRARSPSLAALAALLSVAVPALAAKGPAAHVAPAALGLAIILVVAKLGGHVAARLGQVAVLGELLAGVLLGNFPGTQSLEWMRTDPSIEIFAQVGALVLLFDVGLELTVRDVTSVGRTAAGVAVVGTLASLLFGGLGSRALRPDAAAYSHLFIGAALTATSVGITARVLRDLGKTRTAESRVVLGAAVIDDVLGLVVLTLVSGSISAARAKGGISVGAVAWMVAKTAAFFGTAFTFGSRAAPVVFAYAARLRASGALVAVGLALCFAYAWVADAIGLAPIIGAFTAGLIIEDSHSELFVARGERSLRELVEPVSSFLVPVFFVVMGMRVDVPALANGSALVLAVVLTLAAVLGKLACTAVAGGVHRLPVAMGMIPRGEVTLIYASLGASIEIAGQPILDSALYSALVFVVLATTLAAPAALRWTFQRADALTPREASGGP
jgi:Kef-type K+ transport system membrane component KefB